jgi:hypothetical protein
MTIKSAIIGLFVTPSAEQQDRIRLSRAKVELAELECNLEATKAHRDMLKARIERLEGVVEMRPARSSTQAPHPGPAHFNAGSGQFPAPIMRDRSATA